MNMGGSSGKAMEDAIRLASIGIALLPIDPVEKKPLFKLLPKDEQGIGRVKPLRKSHATPAKIKNWFRRYPNCNIAIITGQPSKLAVLDIDGPTPPDLPELPETAVEKTPRKEGGHHYYFRIEGAQDSGIYRWTEEGVEYKCELRADGVYVICTPSSFGGTPYVWEPGHSIFELEPALLQSGLVEYLESKHEPDSLKRRKGKASRSGVKAASRPGRRSKDLKWYEELKYDEDVAIQILRKCGANVRVVGESFLCPLTGHEEQHPSAALWYNKAGEIIFRDWHWHERDGKEWCSLANVYALCATKTQGMYFDHHDKDWPGHSRWWARALHEAGCVDRPLPTLAMKQELPEDAPSNAKIVYEALCYVAQLEEWFHGKPKSNSKIARTIEFPASFTDTWLRVGDTRCMSRTTRQKGLDWLEENGYIEVLDMDDLFPNKFPSDANRPVKKTKRMRTYVILTKPGVK